MTTDIRKGADLFSPGREIQKEPKPSLAGQWSELSVDAGLGEGRYLCRGTEGSGLITVFNKDRIKLSNNPMT